MEMHIVVDLWYGSTAGHNNQTQMSLRRTGLIQLGMVQLNSGYFET